jgi:hemolysin activation/secretion protein
MTAYVNKYSLLLTATSFCLSSLAFGQGNVGKDRDIFAEQVREEPQGEPSDVKEAASPFFAEDSDSFFFKREPLWEKKDTLSERGLTLHGIYLAGNPKDVKKQGMTGVDGVEADDDLAIPGGLYSLRYDLEAKFIGQPINKELILEVKKEVIQYYRNNNRPVVTVDVPEQEISCGVLQLVVTEGKLGKVIAKGNKWFSDKQLIDQIRIEPGEPIDSNTVLNDVAWMNNNPFRKTNVIFTPGEEEGTTDIELITADKIPLRVYAGIDNTGNRATGRGRWFAGANWGNAFNLGHTFTYQFTAGYNVHRFQSHTVNYVAPLSWRHVLNVYGGYSKVNPDISDFTSNGRSAQASLRYEIPIKNLYDGYLFEFEWGADYKWTNNNLEFVGAEEADVITSNINLFQLVAGFNYGTELKRHKISFSTLFYGSPGEWLPHQSKEAYAHLNPHATPYYFYGRLWFAEEYFIPKYMSIWGQLRLQGSTHPLLPSEQYGLGGYDTVRGYEERQVNTDNAVNVNFELRSRPYKLWGPVGKNRIQDQLIVLGFVDYGYGINDARGLAHDKKHWLLGVGPGLRYVINPYFTARFDLGFRCHKTQFNDGPWAKAHFGLLASY